jgi:RNA 3'-terminal phosphate cyclase (ATP)
LYDQAVRPGKTERIVPTMVKKVSDDLLGEIEHGGCVEEYARDQLVVFQALAMGRSRVFGGKKGEKVVEPSLHARTAMWVCKEMLGVDFDQEGECEGIGITPCGTVEKLANKVDELEMAAS